MHSLHKKILLLSIACFLLISANQSILNRQSIDPTPPLWPEVFSQSIIMRIGTKQFQPWYVDGKYWYDSVNNRERIDSQFFTMPCIMLSNAQVTPCRSLNVNQTLYFWLTEKNLCCKCCDSSFPNCPKIRSRNWLQNYNFQGNATLQNQTFNQWKYEKENYYSTQDQRQLPRRADNDVTVRSIDYLLNSFSTDPIPDSVFTVPSFCNTPCPQNSGCSEQSNFNENDHIFIGMPKNGITINHKNNLQKLEQ